MSNNSQTSNPALTQNQPSAVSENSGDEARLAKNPEAKEKKPAEAPPHDTPNQATIEEFGREGLGIAAKE